MIVFDLRCANGHVFEAWFGSSADHEEQAARGLVACPLCDSREVAKAAMAPAVPAKANRRAALTPREALHGLHALVRAQCDPVGREFAAEARRRHALPEADRPARGIWGEASRHEVAELLAEDIPVATLPPLPPGDA